MPHQITLADVLTHVTAVPRVYVRMALMKDDSQRLIARSLLVDVFPEVWLDKPDNFLTDWLSTPFRYEYDQVGAVLLSEFVDSAQVRQWLIGGECQLRGFDSRPGFGTRVLNFDVPEMQDEITAQRYYSFEPDSYVAMPWPHTVYSFNRKDQTNYYRQNDYVPLVAPDADYYTNFAEARSEIIHGVGDPSQISRYQEGVAVRVVHADAWLNEISVGESELTAIVHGLNVPGCHIVLSGSREIRRRQQLLQAGPVTIPIPNILPREVAVVLTRGQEEFDRAVFYPETSGSPQYAFTYYPQNSRQVVMERDVVDEHEREATPPEDMIPNTTTTFALERQGEVTPTVGMATAAPVADVGSVQGQKAPKVFISYSHDTAQHATKVLALADLLRRDGIDCIIDQYEEAPEQGWPRWMEDQIESAQFVLVVCTQAYTRRFRGHETPGIGLGAAWEGTILTQELYGQAAKSNKIIPVVFSAEDVASIPTIMQGMTRYNLTEGLQYTKLYGRLTNQPLVVKPPLGTIKRLRVGDDDVE